ncbi:hypothetical protein [Elongatibacter sediminis]|uniref:Uncharacterized protein n=1 Tax=Elongatibacter sediminis TaxID=3119006 RepID=A0AAW9RCZ9_9GAMM
MPEIVAEAGRVIDRLASTDALFGLDWKSNGLEGMSRIHGSQIMHRNRRRNFEVLQGIVEDTGRFFTEQRACPFLRMKADFDPELFDLTATRFSATDSARLVSATNFFHGVP